MSLPSWQVRVVRTVDRIVAEKSVDWGHTYAGFLTRQLRRIDEAVGKAPIRTPNLKKKLWDDTHIAITRVHQTHPDWTREQIAHAVGVSIPTVDRHIKPIRETTRTKAQQVADANPTWTTAQIAEAVGITPSAAYSYVLPRRDAPKRNRRKHDDTNTS
jgi:AraC-like DNA-binding protein